MPKPKCKICGQEVDKENQEYVKNSTGYFHKSCRDEREGNKTVKCAFCKIDGKKADMIKADNGRNYHKMCYREMQDRKLLFDYCCQLWNLQSPGPVIMSQATNFRKLGYTYRGMYWSLRYFYEVAGGKAADYKGKEQIGIIKSVYAQAKLYYTGKELEKERIEKLNEVVELKKAEKIRRIKARDEKRVARHARTLYKF